VARAKRKSARTLEPSRPRSDARPSEQLLIDAMADLPAGSILCTSLGRGQFAAAAAQSRSTEVFCAFVDLYARSVAEKVLPEPCPNLRFECLADFPEQEFDVFALPVTAGGDAEFVRDLLQSGHQRLRVGGMMFVATDNRTDTWLHEEMRKLFSKVTRRLGGRGTLYSATKMEPLRKVKDFDCQFAFRDEGRLIQAMSRPGVFSHRRVDGGARALMKAAEVQPGCRILELGCGSGVVSLALALRGEGVHVQAIDSNARAVECTRRGAELNGISTLAVELSTAEDGPGEAASIDLVVANPPYFSNYRIAEIFARRAARVLRPEGTALFVTKKTDWYEETLPRFFSSVTVEPTGQYQIVRCRAKAR
jgi:16S rRNA G1207 methylase RsmC